MAECDATCLFFRWGMQEVLEELGIDPRQGPQSLEDFQDEIDVALAFE